MNIISCIFLALFGMASGATSVTVRVADGDSGEPIKDAVVEIEFPAGMAKDGTICGGIRTRKTNAQGMCSGSGTAAAKYVNIRVEKDGFYESCKKAALLLDEDMHECTEFSIVTVALMRVMHPIPLFVGEEPNCRPRDMFGKGTNTLEFDLMAGDYLPPAGRGKVADIVFTREKCELLGKYRIWDDTFKAETRDIVRVHFPNPGDGIVSMLPDHPSKLRVRTAPADGYLPDYISWRMKTMDGVVRSWEKDPNLAFRIRTKLDGQGRVVFAHYGKIYHGLGFGQNYNDEKVGEHRVEQMRFLYYLNPTPTDMNLEYDMHHNLNKGSDVLVQNP